MRRIIAVTDLENRRAGAELPPPPRCRNLVFLRRAGNLQERPRLLAQLAGNAVSGGAFVEARTRATSLTLYGRDLTLWSPSSLNARGGVLFIDEAGALNQLHGGKDFYAEEAVSTFVRHMELCPETTVIFATYPDKADTLLGQNPGFQPHCTRDLLPLPTRMAELLRYFCYLSQENGYRLPDGWRDPWQTSPKSCAHSSATVSAMAAKMRRLLTEAIGELALRVKKRRKRLDTLSTDDLAAAARGTSQRNTAHRSIDRFLSNSSRIHLYSIRQVPVVG